MSFWKGKRVLVTGGAGFLGSNLAEWLISEGANVRVVDNLERGSLDNLSDIIPEIEFLEGDLREEETCQRATRGIHIVFHFAAKVGGWDYYEAHSEEVLRDNLLMDHRVLRSVVTNRVERYFYASSSHVYPAANQKAAERSRLNSPRLREEDSERGEPLLSYGTAKRVGERELQRELMKHRSFRAVCMRLVGIYGPHQDIDLERGSVIPVLIRRALEYPERKPFSIRTSGEEIRSFCFVSDAVEAIRRSIEKLDEKNLIGPLNVGSEDPVRIRDLASKIIRLSEKRIHFEPPPKPKARLQTQLPDCSRARQELIGWGPKVSLEKGLRLTFADIKKRLRNIELKTSHPAFAS